MFPSLGEERHCSARRDASRSLNVLFGTALRVDAPLPSMSDTALRVDSLLPWVYGRRRACSAQTATRVCMTVTALRRQLRVYHPFHCWSCSERHRRRARINVSGLRTVLKVSHLIHPLLLLSDRFEQFFHFSSVPIPTVSSLNEQKRAESVRTARTSRKSLFLS